jgi:hypothetical protein
MAESIRRMTIPEETAYAIGQEDAESGVPLSTPLGFSNEEKLAYERGYLNFAGETVNG